ncbi:FkbM family methyltransferase [archaeon]|nr:FkbM family methyltransferase [archaeon]
MIKGEADLKFLKSRIKDESKYKLVYRNWREIFVNKSVPGDEGFINIKVGSHLLSLRRGSLMPSLMTYVEVFRDKAHVDCEGFDGSDAGVVVDLGANEGYYALFLKENNPDLRVIAVEPVKPTFEVLKRNVANNQLSKVTLVNKAVTAKSGYVTFEVVPEATAIASFDIGLQDRSWLNPERVKRIRVESTTLPELFNEHGMERVGILKLDVEGSELGVLKSSKSVLPLIERVVVEYHSPSLRNNCIKFLESNGYKLVKERKSACGDLYFMRCKA